MRYRIFGLVGVLGACFAGCSSSSDSGENGTLGGGASAGSGGSTLSDSGAYAGSGGSSGGLSSGGSAGSSYNPSGGSGGTGTDDGGAADAADATPACDTLDQTKSAIFYLSADDSNSMASPAIARGFIEKGMQIPKGFVRIHEFLNYYNVGYPAAPAGQLALTTEMRAGELGSYELQLGVASHAAQKPRRPMNLTLVLDTSGSMSGEPIARQKAAVVAIAGQLKLGDTVTVTTWNTQNQVELNAHAVTGPNDPALVSVANKLNAQGGTDLSGGLKLGYQIAQQHFTANELNRVILISDGQANVGITDENLIGNGAKLNDGDGIYLVGVGVGDGVNDTLMNTVTDLGKGAYVYLDTTAEAGAIFGSRFDEVMDVAARNVQVELQLPWYMAISKFYGEEYSTNPSVVETQHLSPNDAMVFNQIVRPCDASKLLAEDSVKVIARWQTPLDHVQKQVELTTTIGELGAQTPVYIDKAKAIIAYAEALKLGDGAKLTEAAALVEAANPDQSDPELNEIAGLIQAASALY
jgi:Ca-activated chloride channel homolog